MKVLTYRYWAKYWCGNILYFRRQDLTTCQPWSSILNGTQMSSIKEIYHTNILCNKWGLGKRPQTKYAISTSQLGINVILSISTSFRFSGFKASHRSSCTSNGQNFYDRSLRKTLWTRCYGPSGI